MISHFCLVLILFKLYWQIHPQYLFFALNDRKMKRETIQSWAFMIQSVIFIYSKSSNYLLMKPLFIFVFIFHLYKAFLFIFQACFFLELVYIFNRYFPSIYLLNKQQKVMIKYQQSQIIQTYYIKFNRPFFIFHLQVYKNLYIMNQQKKVLWKKIGLQKHILDGTSHSSQSKNNMSQQNSFGNEHNNNMSGNYVNPSKIHKNYQKNDKKMSNFEINQNISRSNSSMIDSPIDNLKFDQTNSFQDKIQCWPNNNNQNQYHQSRQYSEVKFQKNISKDSQAQQFLQNLQKNSFEYENKQVSKNYAKKILTKQTIRQTKKNQKQLQKFNQKGKRTKDIFECFTKSQIEMIECQEMIVIPITLKQKYDKYELIEKNSNKLQMTLTNIREFCKQVKIKNQNVKNQIILQRQNCTYMFKQFAVSIDEQIEELKSQIGYLYKQNSSLMDALSIIEENYRKSQNSITTLELKITQINQENQFLYNKLNSNQEKMEEIQQLQNKIAYLQKELEQSFQRQQKARDLELTLMQKQRLLTISKKEIQNLKKQINLKKEEFIQYQAQLQNKMSEFKFNFQLQRSSQIESIKENLSNRLQKQYNQKIHNYEATIQELLKSLNQLQVQNIIKKFKMQKNQNILNLLSKHKHQINSNQNKADLQFSTLKNYINRNTTIVQRKIQLKNLQKSLSNASQGKISPSFKSEKSHSQQKYQKNDCFQNQERQRSLSTFSQRKNTINSNIVVSSPQKKRKQFVDNGSKGKNTLFLQDYEIQRKKSEINMQKYDKNYLTARQYNSNRIKTQIEQDFQTNLNSKKYYESKGNEYSFSQLNYDIQNDQLYHANTEDFYSNNMQNQSEQSSTIIYLNMLQTKNTHPLNYKLNENLMQKIKKRSELSPAIQKNLPKNYQQLVQKLNKRSYQNKGDHLSQHQYKVNHTSRNPRQNSTITNQYVLPTYNSAVYQTQSSINLISGGSSYHPNQNNTFTKINKTTGNIITSSFAKNKERQVSKSPVPKNNKTFEISSKNMVKNSSNSIYKKQSQQSKNISRLLIARQFKKKP